jgi:hypothetical protein
VRIDDEELVITRRGIRDLGRAWWAAALAIAAALVASGTWYLHRPDTTPHPPLVVTYVGDPVDQAQEVIARADAAFGRYVAQRHGEPASAARCYFDRTGQPIATDIAMTLYCGPVLFYEGVVPDVWLRYVVRPSGTPAGHVRLVLAPEPETAAPIALPSGLQLERPDGSPVPSASGLRAPGPPAAQPGSAVVVNAADLPQLPVMPESAVMVSRDVGITLAAGGYVPSYGREARLRTAPDGEKLLAFELAIGPGEIDDLTTSDPPGELPTLGLVVDGSPVRKVPIHAYGTDARRMRFVVVAVPAGARSVDLVLVDDGVTQRLSLLDGEPGADNVAVLTRDPATLYGHLTEPRTARATGRVNGANRPMRLVLDGQVPSLGYFSPHGPAHASAPDRALLHVAVYFTSPQLPCPGSACGFSFPARDLTLVSDGQPPIHAWDLAHTGDVVFDVPATFRTGVVTLSGSAPTNGPRVTLVRPVRMTVSLPG